MIFHPFFFLVTYSVPRFVTLNLTAMGGSIFPHFFQRPITQKVLKCKKSAKISIPRKTSAKSLSWVIDPSKNVNWCLFYVSEQASAWKMLANSIDHLSWPLHFRPQPDGGVGWQWRWGESRWTRRKSVCGKNAAVYLLIISPTDLWAFFAWNKRCRWFCM